MGASNNVDKLLGAPGAIYKAKKYLLVSLCIL